MLNSGETPYECYLCNKSFPRRAALDDHLQRHRETFTLKCVRCHRRFSNASQLANHEKICRRRRFECHLCGFTEFGLSYNKFKRHMAKHTGEQILKCSGCPNSFATYVKLAKHISKSDHSQLLAVICPNCCLHFSTKTDRDAHQLKCLRKRNECYLCGKTPRTMKDLKNHMTSKHIGLKRFNCRFCSRKFQRKFNLEKHLKTHTKIGLVKCQYCTKKFIDEKYKKTHETYCKKTYECYLCNKTFASFKILHGTHMKTHTGRYQCTHCKKSNASPRTYALHVIDNHLHLYKFQCQTCNGIVKERKDLRIHQKSCIKPTRQATGAIYFKCSLCGVGLARVLQVKKHILFGECKNHPKKIL